MNNTQRFLVAYQLAKSIRPGRYRFMRWVTWFTPEGVRIQAEMKSNVCNEIMAESRSLSWLEIEETTEPTSLAGSTVAGLLRALEERL